jgi:hypothetical protein
MPANNPHNTLASSSHTISAPPIRYRPGFVVLPRVLGLGTTLVPATDFANYTVIVEDVLGCEMIVDATIYY